MRTVTVRVDAADLSRQMAAMREWLDRHRYEPTRFACDKTEMRSSSPLSSLTSGRARRSQAISTTKGRSGPAFPELARPPLPCRGTAVSRFG